MAVLTGFVLKRNLHGKNVSIFTQKMGVNNYPPDQYIFRLMEEMVACLENDGSKNKDPNHVTLVDQLENQQ